MISIRRWREKKVWIAITILGVLVVAGGGGGLLFTAGERREAKGLPIAAVDFTQLRDGTYVGKYQGGMYKWRANTVNVTVSSGRVADIEFLEGTEKRPAAFAEELYGRIIQAQSLQVDVISGATLTSKAYLKAVEDALGKAE